MNIKSIGKFIVADIYCLAFITVAYSLLCVIAGLVRDYSVWFYLLSIPSLMILLLLILPMVKLEKWLNNK